MTSPRLSRVASSKKLPFHDFRGGQLKSAQYEIPGVPEACEVGGLDEATQYTPSNA